MMQNKTQPTSESVHSFIKAIENERRRQDALDTLALYKDITGSKPVMWGPTIIGFGSYSYPLKNGDTGMMPAAAFSPRKANLVFYLGDKFLGAKGLYAQLGKHKKSVACVYINKLTDIDLATLRELIKRDFERRS